MPLLGRNPGLGIGIHDKSLGGQNCSGSVLYLQCPRHRVERLSVRIRKICPSLPLSCRTQNKIRPGRAARAVWRIATRVNNESSVVVPNTSPASLPCKAGEVRCCRPAILIEVPCASVAVQRDTNSCVCRPGVDVPLSIKLNVKSTGFIIV